MFIHRKRWASSLFTGNPETFRLRLSPDLARGASLSETTNAYG